MLIKEYLVKSGERFEKHLQEHKGKYIFQAVGFIIAGLFVMTLSGTTALHAELLAGMALLIAGTFQMLLTLRSKVHGWSLLAACLSLVAGALILWKPFPVLFGCVILLTLFMALEAIIELSLSFWMPKSRQRNWLLFSASLFFGLAVMTWVGYPTFDTLYLGWIVAANFILYGLSLLTLIWKAAS